ncbi:MAG TPA: ArsA-related P-loop ATPase [Solirubrobacteraceae bacterium]
MTSLLERKLIVVTGKGGTGKSTIACALGLLGARRGLRTIVVEIGDQHRIPDLFAAQESRANRSENAGRTGSSAGRHGNRAGAVELRENLWSASIDPDRAMIDWLQTLTGRISARLLASSSTFHYFAAAAPGAKELVSMIEVCGLCEGQGKRKGSKAYDLVVLDAPATGHALAMLESPRTFAAIVRAGPLAEQARAVLELLEDPRRCGYVAVAQGTEMAITETLELEEGLRRRLDRDLDAVIVNGTVPRRFTREELARISTAARNSSLARSAGRVADTVHERARLQQSQIARLRRQRFADGMPPGVVTIPFVFTSELDLAGVGEISAQLERKLQQPLRTDPD